jgi:arginase
VRRLSIDGLAELTLPDRPLHVHLDVDVVDPAGLPGLLYPAPGGPGVAPVVAALRHLGALSQLASVSVAHTYDQHGAGVAESRRVAAELAAALVQPR